MINQTEARHRNGWTPPHDVLLADPLAVYHAEPAVSLDWRPIPTAAPSTDDDQTPSPYAYPLQVSRSESLARRGWQGCLNRGLRLSLAAGRSEAQRKSAVATVRAGFPAARTICVANVKGGAGKTPTVLLLAETLATLRNEPIVAADLNELRGTLGVRALVHSPGLTIGDVLRHIEWLARPGATVGDLAGFLRRQHSGALVLASSENPGEMRSLEAEHCRRVRELILARYSTTVIDTGNNEAAAPWQFATGAADVLVVPMRAADDHVWVAGQMLEGLRSRSATSHLPSSAVAVVTDPDGARLSPDAEHWLSDRVGALLYVPADPAIAGGRINLDRLRPQSVDAWTTVAAAVAAQCAKTSVRDGRPETSQFGAK